MQLMEFVRSILEGPAEGLALCIVWVQNTGDIPSTSDA
jgi:hypothetical protein